MESAHQAHSFCFLRGGLHLGDQNQEVMALVFIVGGRAREFSHGVRTPGIHQNSDLENEDEEGWGRMSQVEVPSHHWA